MKWLYVGVCISAMLMVRCAGSLGAELAEVGTDMPREELAGVAMFPDGVTPIGNLPVRVWSVDKQKMVYRTRTDADGLFHVPIIRVGRYYLFVGRAKININVLLSSGMALSQNNDIVVVLPYRMMVSSMPLVEPVLFAPLLFAPLSGLGIPPNKKVVSP